jgi:hypothetical protein
LRVSGGAARNTPLAEQFDGDLGEALALVAGDLKLAIVGLPSAIAAGDGGCAVWIASADPRDVELQRMGVAQGR